MSRFRFIASIILFSFAAQGILAQSVSGVDTSDWIVYRNDKLGFVAKYPKDWHVQTPTGRGSESVLLGAPFQDGKEHLSLQFWVQRKINSKNVRIDQWYDDQMKAALSPPPPSTRRLLGGRLTIAREVAGSLGINFTFFTSLNETDVFEVTISQPPDHTQLNPVYDAILSSVRFAN